MAFAPSKSKKNPPSGQEMPNLTSMMDMMTIILLFLLKSLSMSGAILHPVAGIQLPKSNTELEPRQQLAFVISNEGLFQDVGGVVGAQFASPQEMEDPQNIFYNDLYIYLDSVKQQDYKIGRTAERRVVTLQGDQNIEYRHLYRFISTCGEAGFSTIQFIVEKAK